MFIKVVFHLMEAADAVRRFWRDESVALLPSALALPKQKHVSVDIRVDIIARQEMV